MIAKFERFDPVPAEAVHAIVNYMRTWLEDEGFDTSAWPEESNSGSERSRSSNLRSSITKSDRGHGASRGPENLSRSVDFESVEEEK